MKKDIGAIKTCLVTKCYKRPCTEDEENKNCSENNDIATSPTTVDKYSDEIDNKSEKVDVAENQSEDGLNAPENSAKAES